MPSERGPFLRSSGIVRKTPRSREDRVALVSAPSDRSRRFCTGARRRRSGVLCSRAKVRTGRVVSETVPAGRARRRVSSDRACAAHAEGDRPQRQRSQRHARARANSVPACARLGERRSAGALPAIGGSPEPALPLACRSHAPVMRRGPESRPCGSSARRRRSIRFQDRRPAVSGRRGGRGRRR